MDSTRLPEQENLLNTTGDGANNNGAKILDNSYTKGSLQLDTPGDIITAGSDLIPRKPSKIGFAEVSLDPTWIPGSEAEAKVGKEPLVVRLKRFRGLGYILLNCMTFSLGGVIAKYLTYHAITKCLWRFQGLLLPPIPIMLYLRYGKEEPIFDTVSPLSDKERRTNFIYLVVRASTGYLAILFQFYSLRYISLADQMVIGSCVPVFVSLFAFCLLGEKFGYVQFALCIMSILGVGIVARPPFLTGADAFDTDALIGFAFAVASMFMAVLTIVFTRRMKKIHFLLITFAYGLCSVVYSLLLGIPMGVLEFPQGQQDTLLIIAFACLAFVCQSCMTLALKYEQASTISLVRTLNIAFAFFWQYIFLGATPDIFSIVGALIIAFAVALTALKKVIETLPKTHLARRMLCCLLW